MDEKPCAAQETARQQQARGACSRRAGGTPGTRLGSDWRGAGYAEASRARRRRRSSGYKGFRPRQASEDRQPKGGRAWPVSTLMVDEYTRISSMTQRHHLGSCWPADEPNTCKSSRPLLSTAMAQPRSGRSAVGEARRRGQHAAARAGQASGSRACVAQQSRANVCFSRRNGERAAAPLPHAAIGKRRRWRA